MESAILISHTELLGFFSLAREEGKLKQECLGILLVSMLDLDPPGLVAPRSVG